METMVNGEKYSRGSEWREWDLHVHSPASFHWNGPRFGTDRGENLALLDQMIDAFNSAKPAVFAIMDYWTFDGWFALKDRLAQSEAPKLSKTVFPGIELRLSAPMLGRLNAHVLFSDKINDQYLKDFISCLKLELINQPLSPNGLIEYARYANADKLKHHGFDKDQVQSDDGLALEVGCKIAEVNTDSYKAAIQAVPNNLAVGFMPFSTNDGLAQIHWSEHYAYALGLFKTSPIFLFKTSPIFETRNEDQWAAFAGVETAGNRKWFSAFQAALKNVPRLAVSGSDSHSFKGIAGNNNKRGYGDFPSGKKTWIKADPTWQGLLHVLREPAKRSFLGDSPPKLEMIKQHKTFYIDSLKISKIDGSSLSETWLHGCELMLNPDLVAIIGNKGSGKSALADIIALLSNSQQKAHFSFLKKDRFRGKAGEPSKQFLGELRWLAGDPNSRLLCDDPPADKVEMVKYIPQGRFEVLCNDHVSGRSNAFEQELRTVIFSHLDPSVRLDALDFDQLVEKQEVSYRAQLDDARQSVNLLNSQIVSFEEQLQSHVKSNVEEQLSLKNRQLEELQSARPVEVSSPAVELTPEQIEAGDRLNEINTALSSLELQQQALNIRRQQNARRRRSRARITEHLEVLQKQYEQLQSAINSDLEVLGISLTDVLSFQVKLDVLVTKDSELSATDDQISTDNIAHISTASHLNEERARIALMLNEPQQAYQKFLADLKVWQNAVNAAEGSPTEPESKAGLEQRLLQINELPNQLAEKKMLRSEGTGKIFDILSKQREAREALFQPLQDLIQNNSLIRDDYKLQFQAKLKGSPDELADSLFSLIKQATGALRGEDESIAAITEPFERRSFEKREDAISFVDEITALLESTAQASGVGIGALLRKGKSAVDVYNLVYALNYLTPQYSLLFQDTEIERLSPGQRGALLLIFYLLVDKGRNPILLDQPEENLDNETVVSLLVPVLNEAKKTRQIIMVTHNPNLAVVCDAEQIIYSSFDRNNNSKITYTSGSIEDGDINKFVVDVLEGTKRAFKNRGDKYH